MLKKILNLGSSLTKEDQKKISGGFDDCFFLGTCTQTILCQCLNIPEEIPVRLPSCSSCKAYCNNGTYLCTNRF
ncbi:hypothetical protein [Tenacibaculum jejuense]|uniref:hypothetical protein n=1 Tax=Tenacibaculum jejuense TaxID=584609 RepID=UPI000BA3453E|nr:hypothetical protein [Tenacibaculum jejuense]